MSFWLSWDCPQYALPPAFLMSVYSRLRPRPLPSVPTCHSRDHVPPIRFLTATMVYSKHKLQVYCNPSQTGFATFYQTHTDNQPSKLDRVSGADASRRSSYPSKVSPRRQPTTCHHASLPSCRLQHLSSCSTPEASRNPTEMGSQTSKQQVQVNQPNGNSTRYTRTSKI